MDWKAAGEYFMGCTCSGRVHWPIDGSMNDQNGACDSVSIFRFNEGFYDAIDLAGVRFAVFNFFPPKISSGNWRMGLVIDSGATDEQAAAVEPIMRGVEGGPMASVGMMIGDYMGNDRSSIGYLEGDRLFGVVEGRGNFTFRATMENGEPVLAPNAMFVFAEDYRIGRSEGKATAFGRAFTLNYGEYGRFSFNSNNTGMEREFRPSRIAGVYGPGRRR